MMVGPIEMNGLLRLDNASMWPDLGTDPALAALERKADQERQSEASPSFTFFIFRAQTLTDLRTQILTSPVLQDAITLSRR